jgi:hypothetical protein
MQLWSKANQSCADLGEKLHIQDFMDMYLTGCPNMEKRVYTRTLSVVPQTTQLDE